MKEIGKLRMRECWDEKGVMEASEAKELFPEAHFASIFKLVGIKNHEQDPKFWKWKGRVVLGGHNVTSAYGQKIAMFQDTASSPSSMYKGKLSRTGGTSKVVKLKHRDDGKMLSSLGLMAPGVGLVYTRCRTVTGVLACAPKQDSTCRHGVALTGSGGGGGGGGSGERVITIVASDSI